MADRSLQTVLDAISALEERIRSAKGLSAADQIRQKRTLMLLDGVTAVLKAYCEPALNNPGYYEFEFTGKSGSP